MPTPDLWTVPPLWKGETVFLLGGGPSLRPRQVERLRGRGRFIAINRAFEVAPWADILFWGDGTVYQDHWYAAAIDAFPGMRVTVDTAQRYPEGVKRVIWNRVAAWSRDPQKVCGACSGGMCINLAGHLGASTIVLLGYDFGPGHWHDGHPHPSNELKRRRKFMPAIEKMAAYLAAAGIKVVNANPASLLKSFPFVDLNDFGSTNTR